MVAVLLESPGDYIARATKRCSRCGEVKPVDDFPWKAKTRGLRRVWCRDCCRAYGREHYRKNRPIYLAKAERQRRAERPVVRERLFEYLRTHPCVDCGETNILLLDLDHRERSEKRSTVSRLIRSSSWVAVEREIAKCDVRCANCHRRRTAGQLNWRKDPRRGTLDAAKIASLGPLLTRPSATGKPAIEQLSIWSVGTFKLCYRCHTRKALHEFSLRARTTGARHGFCRSCQAEYRRQHYERNRDRYIARAIAQVRQRKEGQTRLVHDYLQGHPCVDRGESDITVLEFDHRDGVSKSMEISSMVGRRNWNVVLAEIEKCDVRCVNCHRRRTAEMQVWVKRFGEASAAYGRIETTRE